MNTLRDKDLNPRNTGKKHKEQKEKKVHMDRVSTLEMIDSMRILKPEKPLSDPVIINYNSNGDDDSQIKAKFADNKTCASFIKTSKETIYKIKIGRDGNPYNPNKEGFSYSLTAEDRLSNGLMFKFKEVNQKAFDNYLQFLRTKYDSFLNVVGREL